MTRKPPFRADQVGSLLRPKELVEARDKAAKGTISAAQLRQIEDRSIRDAVKMQEAAGLRAVTDGEFRRAFWHTDFLTGIEGIVATKTDYSVAFKGEGGETAGTSTMMVVNNKVKRTKPIMVDHFAYLKSVAREMPKFCIPSPTYLHMRGGKRIVPPGVYADMEDFWTDIVRAYREEIRDLAAAGCNYLQLDDVTVACLCDKDIRAQVKADGEDPDKLPAKYASVVNAILAQRPASLSVTMHTCRGNHMSMWMASGGYDPVAETVFGGTAVE